MNTLFDKMAKDPYINLRDQLGNVLEHIAEDERNIVVMRFGIEGNAPFTLKDVFNATGICNDEARLTEGAALRRLREHSVDHEKFYIRHEAKRDPFFVDGEKD